ncbi:MAG: 4-hydroxyphenylacetate 3-hydroxylase [Chloroflexi bacterium]|nr:4-hydroxyphenylacetate 3-hydroxylase [Chloroflexota bacterium]
MSIDISTAKGAKTGQGYIESLRDGREVWLDGVRVDDVTTHPAFSGMVQEMARIYDLQYTDELRDLMTYESPETGNRISYSYSLPRTYEELMARKRNSEIWMQESFGQLGRTPDFCSSVVCGWYDMRHILDQVTPKLAGNAERFWRFAAEHDVAMTHAIGDPQVDRTSTVAGENQAPGNAWAGVGGYAMENPEDDEATALHVVKETREGIVLRGAKQLATLAPLANECLVYLSATFSNRANNEFVQWFSVPMNAPGLVTVCREPFSVFPGSWGHPFGGRFDEQDAMMFFDNVLVPWDHVVMLYDAPTAVRYLGRINTLAGYSSNIRLYERIRTFVAVVTMLAKANEIDEIRGVRDMLGELVAYAEMIRLAIRGMDADAQVSDGGLMLPGDGFSLGIFAAQISKRVLDVLQIIGGMELVSQPSEKDLANEEIRPYLDKLLPSNGLDTPERVRLFRLAYDVCMSAFATRQEIYEYWHRGDVTRNRSNLYGRYNRGQVVDRINELLSRPM